MNRLDRWNQSVLHSFRRRDVHGRGERVVRRLRHVDVIVGMDRLLRSHLAAGNFDRAVGDDLVHVHVGLGAAAGLPDAERELIIQLAGDDFVGRLDDKLRFVSREVCQDPDSPARRLFSESRTRGSIPAAWCRGRY